MSVPGLFMGALFGQKRTGEEKVVSTPLRYSIQAPFEQLTRQGKIDIMHELYQLQRHSNTFRACTHIPQQGKNQT